MSSSSISMAVISDSNNTVSYFPENSRTDRQFKDDLFAFATSGSSKSAPSTLVSREYDNGRYIQYAMHDDKGNFVGCVGDNQKENDTTKEELLQDLLQVAYVSSLAATDESFQKRVSKLFSERCADESKRGETMENVEVFKRVLEKKKKKKQQPSAAPAADAGKTTGEKTNTAEDNKTTSTKKGSSSSSPVEVVTNVDVMEKKLEAETSGHKCEEEQQKGHHSHHHSYHTEEFEAEWKLFQNSNQFKASAAVIGLSAVASIVMMVCSPNFSSCQ